MTTVEINLPDQLALEARQAGLLTSAQLERWVREQLRQARLDHSQQTDEPVTPDTTGNQALTAPNDDPAFGIWRDRQDMADVANYVRKLRQPRYNRDGSRNDAK
jgi:hypothetical protein